jgi:predicted dithiol-disulfide oxidoreductase (DUF899 family)
MAVSSKGAPNVVGALVVVDVLENAATMRDRAPATSGGDAMPDDPSSIDRHKVVSHEDWLSARSELLTQERDFTRLRDELSRKRRELPWEKVEKRYVFEGPRGTETLAELFERKSQLVVYHFMFGPDEEEGCKHCSFWADNFDGIIVHLNHRDVSFVAVSRAPLAKIDAFKKRMGWSFKWVSSLGSDFNYDYGVSFTPEQVKSGSRVYNYSKSNPGRTDREGASVFFKDAGGAVFHTYSCFARGIDMLNTAYHYLDIVPKGRDEEKLPFTQEWVRYHDRYED